MKNTTLTIAIARTPQAVFDFTINPVNTPKWIVFVKEERINEWPPKVGTIYRNRSSSGLWSEYEVTSYRQNHEFTLSRKHSSFHVTYTVKPIGHHMTELKYHEWVDEGELENQFTQDALEKLKQVMESEV